MKLTIRNLKKEDGLNYINFTISGMILAALILILYLFQFRVQINSLENRVSTGVQMAEDSILSASCTDTLHAKEQDRYHIIINASADNVNVNNQVVTATEEKQIKYLADYYLNQIKETFYLNDNNIPTAGELYNLRGKSSPVLINELIFYEAIYNDEISYNKLKTHNYDNIRYFIKYEIPVTNNKYAGSGAGTIKKTLVQKNNAKIDGKKIEGSTVDSEISSKIYINSFFAELDVFPISINKDVQMGIVSAAHDSRLVK